MAAVLDIVIMLIVAGIGLTIWGSFYAQLCSTILGTQAMSLLGLAAFFLAAIVILRMVVGGLTIK